MIITNELSWRQKRLRNVGETMNKFQILRDKIAEQNVIIYLSCCYDNLNGSKMCAHNFSNSFEMFYDALPPRVPLSISSKMNWYSCNDVHSLRWGLLNNVCFFSETLVVRFTCFSFRQIHLSQHSDRTQSRDVEKVFLGKAQKMFGHFPVKWNSNFKRSCMNCIKLW